MFIRAIQTFCIVSELNTTKKSISKSAQLLCGIIIMHTWAIVSSLPSHNIAKVFAAIFFFFHFLKFLQICLLSIGSVKNDFSIPNGIQSQWRSYCLVQLLYWGFFFLFENVLGKHKTKIPSYTER